MQLVVEVAAAAVVVEAQESLNSSQNFFLGWNVC
jgi:hypothetical protein